MNFTMNSTAFYTVSTLMAVTVSYNEPESVYVNAKEWIWKIVPPVIVTFGSFGNGLIILVLLRQIRTLSSTAIYLLSLAFSDLMILFLGPVRQWIMYIWNVDVRLLSDAGCKTSLFFTYLSFHLSSWLLVAVTIERVISVVLPHKVKFACTTLKAGIIVLITVVILATLNVHFFYGFGLNTVSTNTKVSRQCSPLYEDYEGFVYRIFPWIDFAVVFALPFIILLTGNLLIIASLKRRAHNRGRMGATKVQNDGMSITILLIMLCIVFCICLTPANIFFILLPYLRSAAMDLPKSEMLQRKDILIFIHAIVNCFNYINSTTNFMLYCLSGSRFRTEVHHLLSCQHAGNVGVFSSRSPRKSSKYMKLGTPQTHKTTETVSDTGNGRVSIKTIKGKDTQGFISDVIKEKTVVATRCYMFVLEKTLKNHNLAETETFVSHL